MLDYSNELELRPPLAHKFIIPSEIKIYAPMSHVKYMHTLMNSHAPYFILINSFVPIPWDVKAC